MKYPKKVILAITAHGTIPLYKKEPDDEYTPHFFYLPTGRELSVTKISSVVPGVCNITNNDDVDKNMKYLLNTLRTFDVSTATRDKKKEFLDEAQRHFQEMDKDQARDIRADLSKKQKTLLEKEQKTVADADDELEALIEVIELTQDIESDKQYLYHKQNYRRDTYVNAPRRQGILYKIYHHKPNEHLKSTFDYKINVLNVTGIPDLFSEMNKRRSGRSAHVKRDLNLEEIIHYLYSKKKVNEIIIFDFSCSSFTDAETHEPVMDERFIRSVRKSLLKERLHGGAIKRRTKRNADKKSRRTLRLKLHPC